MTTSPKSCAVASPGERNSATPDPADATSIATTAQPATLKELAEAIFRRNRQRNSGATVSAPPRNSSGETAPRRLRTQVAPCTDEPCPTLDWLHPCPVCSGRVFTESDHGGFFCTACQELPEGAKPLRTVEAGKPSNKIRPIRARQVNCQAYEYTGFLMSTHPDHCRDWHGPYCKGCPLQITH